MKVLYDMEACVTQHLRFSTPSELTDVGIRNAPCVQGVGDVITKTHRCIAFPNLYQHRLQPFGLEDPTRPGHRRVLVFFLVDPTQKVLSATDVAPQQGWITKTVDGTGQNESTFSTSRSPLTFRSHAQVPACPPFVIPR